MISYKQFLEEAMAQHQISDEHGKSNVPHAMHSAHNSLTQSGYKRVGFHSAGSTQSHYYEHPNKPAVTVQHFHDGDQASVTVHHEATHARNSLGRVSGEGMHTREQGKGHEFIHSIK